MKKGVLAISAALLLAAVLILPATSFTYESKASPYPFSNGAGSRPAFTMATGVPAHNLTPGVFVAERESKYSISTGTPYKYSINSQHYEYSFNLASQVEQPAPTPAPEPAPVTTPAPAPAPVTYSISGMIYEDLNGNMSKDADEMGLGSLTVNLEQPAGTIIATIVSAEDGTYSFADLMAGEYVVSVDMPEGWEAVAPVSVVISDMNVTADFPAKRTPVAPMEQNVTAPTKTTA